MKPLPLFHISLWFTGPRKYFYHGSLTLIYNHIHLKYCPETGETSQCRI